MYQNDIISAIATAPGEGGIGIVRISGAGCAELAEAMFRAASGRKLKDYRSHQAVYGRVLDENDKVIDEAICLIMRAPHSYTCEDVIELQCHGGAMALREVLRRSYQL
ncbi:MAG: tRNA uridine-5-carboxymethylaminomethyl(34) synthesis GTPase MnmE, partial [Selenomonadales bacterium]|nr:tRNA uridine-5-carboxymethylaminomethyl(34) synthesis GTPase MnmE [Selenomonadales bacterium]